MVPFKFRGLVLQLFQDLSSVVWKTALLQTLILVMYPFFVYYPFIKQMDKQALQAEIQKETSDLEDEDW